MFIGHFAVGFGAKKAAPEVSLGTLFLCAQLADLIWPNLVLLGVEHFEIRPGITRVTPLDFTSYPYSHSLVAALVWSLLAAVIYFIVRRGPIRAAAVVGVLVASHWVLDVASHRPDMPVTIAGNTKLGLGLWNSLPATMAVEFSLFFLGVMLYLRATTPKDNIGRYALAGLVAFLLIINVMNLFGPPPPSVNAVAWSAQAMWLLVAWGYWVDRHRATRT
jgi:hypothetical protein